MVPLGSWCVRLITMLRELAKGKQPDDLIFTRGLNHRPVQRFDKLEARLPHGRSEREPSGPRPAANGGATNAGRRDSGAAHHADCGWKTMSTFLRYAMTGRNVLRPELEKLVEFERKQRQGRQELVKQKGWRMVSKRGDGEIPWVAGSAVRRA